MEEKTNGWVVVTYNHGLSGGKFMITWSFARTRKESIQLFLNGGMDTWEYWRRNFNYRCVKAQSNIKVN